MKINNKRNEIIDVAYNLFINNGYDNTTVDEIILNVGIAKGTFYYYFKTKEELLEGVIDKMLSVEEERALLILNSDMSINEKLIGVITSMRPNSSEMSIGYELNKPENMLMHKKMNDKIIKMVTPIISRIVDEGIKMGIFDCDNVSERVKLILLISNLVFDDDNYTDKTIDTFIDTIEKILGAKKGTMMFVKKLINGGNNGNNN